ncbi:MAG TPA: hypothetical protein EYO01_06875 [Phycisphaerales bacterium]|nr:hypothetical protein [Phycisphaerales bacterium]HIB01972.1 hypothetical protein [Phycisphaerales bacterium]HIB50347.1 hypothetical protein [Phycisphaerales bacterium]HIN84214.1 hypothetical protein [Phycisphaerales bacterium]HIO19637.1 hypothetical protein [Phycisphaerales bacterium]
MRLIFEHPWLTSISVGTLGFALLWVGLREQLITRIKIGIALLIVAIVLFVTGTLVQTPTENAKRVVYGFLDAVEEGKVGAATSFLHKDVILKDSWNGRAQNGRAGVRASLEELYRRHSLQYNTILKTRIVEKVSEVHVELYLFTRVSGIGSVPSQWRILVHESQNGVWEIFSIDAIEIAYRSFR